MNENRYQTKSVKEKKIIQTSKETNGIIDYLIKKNGGNVCEKRALNVTASSTNTNLFATNVADIHNNNVYFLSNCLENSWLKYDFINIKVNPTGYSITTRPSNDNHLRNWVIEGSNNDNDWEVLDKRQNDQSLTGIKETYTFDIKKQDKSYRFLRIRQTGGNSSNDNFLSFTSLEFFGSISE